MIKKYKQTDSISCGIIALSHLIQRDFITDGLRDGVIIYESFKEISKDYYKFAVVYAVGNEDTLITWINN